MTLILAALTLTFLFPRAAFVALILFVAALLQSTGLPVLQAVLIGVVGGLVGLWLRDRRAAKARTAFDGLPGPERRSALIRQMNAAGLPFIDPDFERAPKPALLLPPPDPR